MNAIILAAGLGSRFNNLTRNNHKALLPINGLPNIERTINYLNDFGVDEIVIVTGHMANLFDYLTDKFSNIKLIYNSKYKEYNSIYSFYCAIDSFGDSFVIDCDVVLFKNIFRRFDKSRYYTIVREASSSDEWLPILGENGYVTSMEISKEQKPSMLGISYWTKTDAEKILLKTDQYLTANKLLDTKLYWDNIPVSILDQLEVGQYLVTSEEAGEMDNYEEYINILKFEEKRDL